MNIGRYLHLVEGLEREIVDLKLDSLVCGLGPTAWLLRYVDRKITAPLRIWGAHDFERIMPCDDLVIMDAPHTALGPDTHRFEMIVNARPKRVWLFKGHASAWMKHLAPSMHPVTTVVPWAVWNPQRTAPHANFKLEATPNLHTIAISPTGTTTLAWREGCRRIGVAGVDMMSGHHHTFAWSRHVDGFFTKIAGQAAEQGGLIAQLSPISSLTHFRACNPSASSSEPTATSETPERSSSLNTPSASTPPSPLRSHGCEPERRVGR